LQDEHHSEINQRAFYEDWDNSHLLDSIANELKNIESSNIAVLNILKLLNDKILFNKGSFEEVLKPRNYRAKKVLGEEIFNKYSTTLLFFDTLRFPELCYQYCSFSFFNQNN
jgi:hypothetical protein